MTNGMNVSRRDLFKFGGLGRHHRRRRRRARGLRSPAEDGEHGRRSCRGRIYLRGPELLQKPAEITEFDEEHTYDVVVVGAGESGLSAMHAALEAGATVGRAAEPLHQCRPPGNMGASIDLTKTNEAGIKAVLSFINYKSDYRANFGPGRDLGPQLPGGAGLVGRGCGQGRQRVSPTTTR